VGPIRYTETRHETLAAISAGTFTSGGLYSGSGKRQAVDYLSLHRLIHVRWESGRAQPVGLTQDGEVYLYEWNSEYGVPGTVALGPVLASGEHDGVHPQAGFRLVDYGDPGTLKCSWCHRRVRT
jgi:hypothetical protein